MNNKDNTIFLKHILDSIGKIERYLQDFDFEKFKTDEEKIDAVVRNVEIIGEASNNLTSRFSLETYKRRMAKNYCHEKPNYSRLRDC